MQAEIYGEKVLRGELVHPFNAQGMTGVRFKQRSELRVAVAPEPRGWQVAMQLRMDFAHSDAHMARRIGP